MSGNIARVQPNILDPVLLTNVAKKVSEVGAKNEKSKYALGDFLFEAIFNNKLKEAINFGHNAYYRSLLSMAKINALGSVTPYWIKMVVHVDTMGRVLDAAKKSKNYHQLSYTHKSRFVGIDFSRAAFVADTCRKVIEGEWNAQALGLFMHTHALKTGQKRLTSALAKRTVRKLLLATERAKAVRTSSKSTYRQMFKHFDEDDFDALYRNVTSCAPEWGRFAADVEAERQARMKKRSQKTKK